LVFTAFFLIKIKTYLTEKLLKKVLRAFTPMLLAFFSDSDSLRTGSTCEEWMAMLIPEEPKLLMFFCLQAAALPTFSSSFLTFICPPGSI
jgi:hypothetical protein